MESFEFLGGRYNRSEQIMSGSVEAFRARNAATGQTVFIHRVSTTEAPEEQSALLKLLTTALVKSADARTMVLDSSDESGYWYVVTEGEPRCALLREWLHSEINAAMSGEKLAGAEAKASAVLPGDPGEFGRIIQEQSASSAGGHTAQATASDGAKSAPGEFANFFSPNAPKAPPILSPRPFPSQPVADSPASAPGPSGEFTRFFKPGVPPLPAQSPGHVTATISSERSQSSPLVQPPQTAIPPVWQQQGEDERIKLFSDADASVQQHSAAADDPFENLLNGIMEAGTQSPSLKTHQAESSRTFGAAAGEGPLVAPPVVVAPPRDLSFLSEAAPAVRSEPVRRSEKKVDGSSPGEATQSAKQAYAAATPVASPASIVPQSPGSSAPMDADVISAKPVPLVGRPLSSTSVTATTSTASDVSPEIPATPLPIPTFSMQSPTRGKTGTSRNLIIVLVIVAILAVIMVILFMMNNR